MYDDESQKLQGNKHVINNGYNKSATQCTGSKLVNVWLTSAYRCTTPGYFFYHITKQNVVYSNHRIDTKATFHI